MAPPTPILTQEQLDAQPDSTLEPTQGTNNPEPSPIEETPEQKYVRELEAQLATQGQNIRDLSTALARQTPAPVVETTPALPNIDPESDRQRLFSDPRTLIREELQAAVAPLQALAEQLTRGNKFETLDRAFKSNPQFTAVMEDHNIIDAVHSMLSTPGAIVNEQSYAAALVSAIGLQHIGHIPRANQPNTPTPTPNGVNMIPPSFRPTAPAPARTDNVTTKRVFNENERLIMRVNNIKEEDFDAWMNLSASQVVSTDIGKPKGNK
jgi:hypothetical protein